MKDYKDVVLGSYFQSMYTFHQSKKNETTKNQKPREMEVKNWLIRYLRFKLLIHFAVVHHESLTFTLIKLEECACISNIHKQCKFRRGVLFWLFCVVICFLFFWCFFCWFFFFQNRWKSSLEDLASPANLTLILPIT